MRLKKKLSKSAEFWSHWSHLMDIDGAKIENEDVIFFLLNIFFLQYLFTLAKSKKQKQKNSEINEPRN